MSDLKAPINRVGNTQHKPQGIRQIKPSHMNQGNRAFYPGRTPVGNKPAKPGTGAGSGQSHEEPSHKAS